VVRDSDSHRLCNWSEELRIVVRDSDSHRLCNWSEELRIVVRDSDSHRLCNILLFSVCYCSDVKIFS